MNAQYTIRTLFAAALLTCITGGVAGQDSVPQKADSSLPVSLHKSTTEPGRLFETPKKFSTAAVSSVSGETLYKTPTGNFTNTLYGRLPGLTVTQGSGEPGADDALLGIRGIGTYGYLGGAGGYHTYKIFVDGFEANRNYFRNLSPAEIESVSILKDGAALATLGMRGSNGAIWVTTRRGKIGKPTVQVQARTGIQQPLDYAKPLRAYEYASLYNQANSNDHGNVWTPRYTPAQLQEYQDGTGVDVDWYSEAVKDQTTYTDADLIFSGGDPTTRYMVVMDYADQRGLYNVPKTDSTSNLFSRRYNVRANLDFNLFEIFEARVDLSGRINERKQPNYNSGQLWNDLARYPSNIYPIKDAATGEWSGTTVFPNNPLASISELGWTSNTARLLQGNFELKEKLDDLLPGLYMSQAFSFNSYTIAYYSKTSNYARFFNGSKTTTDQTTPIRASSQSPAGQEDWKQFMATIGYKKQWGDHQVNSAVNYHQSDFRGDGFYALTYRYQNISGRGNYVYKNKYVGEIGFSYFGSDAYAPGNRFGFYPALSAAWILSEEDFLKNNTLVSELKLRASVGKTGGSDSEGAGSPQGQNGRFLYQQYYQANGGLFYTGNGTPASQNALLPLYIANPDIFAEQSIKYNVGVDASLFGKLDLSVDLFLDKRSDIITRDNSVPGAFGNINIIKNLGKQTNKGFELNAAYTNQVGKLGYTISGMAFYNRNTIDYMAEVTPAFPYNAQTGRSYGTRIGLVASGFYQLSDFNADGSLKTGLAVPAFGAVQPGDLRYEDLDGDHIIDQRDVTEIGEPAFPRWTYSFGGQLRYSGFDLELLFQGAYGGTVDLLSYTNISQPFVNNGNVYALSGNAWAYYPDQGIDTRAQADFPRLTTQGNNNNYRSSSFWIRNNDFLRLRNVTLGYALPSTLLQRYGLSQMRIYVNAVNPLTWSRLQQDYDLDPETVTGYPAMKSFNAGISITF